MRTFPKRPRQASSKHAAAIDCRGRPADGEAVHLVVRDTGARRLLLRIVVEGRRRELVLGGGAVVELAEAPERIRRLARFAGDPIAGRQLAEVDTPTFREVAERWRAETAPNWRNGVHAAQWLSSLAAYAFPFFGDHAIDTIGRSDIVKVLAPIWMTKPETARRVRQRIRKILEWARFKYELAGPNPVDGVVHALPRQPRRCGHFAALPYSDIPAFWTQLEGLQGEEPRASIQALQLVVLTACRSHEVRLAKKEEFDFAAQIWTIPRERMKADAAHVVPLSPRAMEIVRCAYAAARHDCLLFPGRQPGAPLSNMAMLMVLRRLGYNVTTHGFRSSFRDWAAEETLVPNFVVEKALAHAIHSEVEAAYRRGNLLKRRRELMVAWEAFCLGATPPADPVPAQPAIDVAC